MAITAGERFGLLVAVRQVGKAGSYRTWLCRCDCGNEIVVRSGNLRSGNSRACGCRKGKNRLKHGDTPKEGWTPEYQAWSGMIQRCTNPNVQCYYRYGGRGIRVHEQWRDYKSFLNYILTTIGRRPSPLHSIDRKDNDGHYEPGNIRWATRKEQANNRHYGNRYVSYHRKGEYR